MTTSSTLHSNALNFLSYVQTGVDPRTGQYTASIALPELKANALCGPTLPLSLSYSPLNTLDSGFGKGWNLRLSQFDPVSRVLSLASGETFHVPPGRLGEKLEVPERKLETFHFYDLSTTRFRVVYKSGQEEILEAQGLNEIALPVQVLNAQGHAINLAYTHHNRLPLLQSVSDSRGALLHITRAGSRVDIDLHPQSPLTAQFSLYLQGSDNRLMRLEMPDSTPGNWRFDYSQVRDLLCISEVHTPVGGLDRVSYTKAGGDSGHLFPGGTHTALPRVMSLISEPGFGQPSIEVRYDYALEPGEGPQTQTNFLGLNASGLVWRDDNRDNLYRADNSYLYGSKEMLWDASTNSALRTITRRFNNFHLLISERTEQNDHVSRSVMTYHLEDGKPFDEQPAHFQLPKVQTSIWEKLPPGGDVRIDHVTTEFDLHGNLIKQLNADGTVEENSWYPAAGEGEDCPADPHGFVRHQRDNIKTPAPVNPATGNLAGELHRERRAALSQRPVKIAATAPTLKTHYRYAAFISAQSPRPWIARTEERLLDISAAEPVQLQVGTTSFHEDPSQPFLLGHVEHVETAINGHTQRLAYAYSLQHSARANETVLQTISTKTGFDGQIKVTTNKVSLLTGYTLQDNDDSGFEHLYEYDALGRLTRETTAADTEYQASRNYSYTLTRAAGQQASQRSTDVVGATRITYVDGLGRTLREERVPQPGALPIPLYEATYDALGNLTHDSRFDNLDGVALQLTTAYLYDDWGQLHETHHADGVIDCQSVDPIQRTQRSWQQDSATPPLIVGHSKTQFNLFGKPATVSLLGNDDQVLSVETYAYDGLARSVEYIGAMDTLTEYEYDPFGRLLASVLPDLTRLETTWAEHSSAELAAAITVVPGSATRPPQAPESLDSPSRVAVVAGRQKFDSLDRLVSVQCGPRIRTHLYREQQVQPYATRTFSGQQINYQYQSNLTTQPSRITCADEEAIFTYHPTTAQLQSSKNTRGSHEYEYDLHRHKVKESWVERDPLSNAERRWEVANHYSQDGRLLNRIDVTGLQTTYGYDGLGRLITVDEGQLSVGYRYDSLGRAWQTTCTQGNRRIVTALKYDERGNEVERTLDLTGHPARVQTMAYRADGRASRRTLTQGGNLLLQEDYRYDPRGRLDRYECSGSELPADRYGNRIRLQIYVFDALDNITLLQTTFADNRIDRALFRFASDDPCQLLGITHTHPAYPASVELAYDLDGHLVLDENGQALRYDSLGRLNAVHAPDGSELCSYHYDGHNLLIGTRRQQQPLQRRFYRNGRLNSTELDTPSPAGTQASERLNYLFGGAQPLGQQRADGSDSLLFMTDFKNSVVGESSASGLAVQTYGAYGEHPDNGVLETLLGYNGEVRDPVSGWYLLGQGYRAYNPSLMRFHSPDSFSPFDGGGVNPYCYGLGDPVGYSDPTGHLGLWDYIGIGAGVVGLALSIGFAAPLFVPAAAAALAATMSPGALATTMLSLKLSLAFSVAGTAFGFAAMAGDEAPTKSPLAITGWIFDALSVLTPMGLMYAHSKGWVNLVKGATAGADDVAGQTASAASTLTRAPTEVPVAPVAPTRGSTSVSRSASSGSRSSVADGSLISLNQADSFKSTSTFNDSLIEIANSSTPPSTPPPARRHSAPPGGSPSSPQPAPSQSNAAIRAEAFRFQDANFKGLGVSPDDVLVQWDGGDVFFVPSNKRHAETAAQINAQFLNQLRAAF